MKNLSDKEQKIYTQKQDSEDGNLHTYINKTNFFFLIGIVAFIWNLYDAFNDSNVTTFSPLKFLLTIIFISFCIKRVFFTQKLT